VFLRHNLITGLSGWLFYFLIANTLHRIRLFWTVGAHSGEGSNQAYICCLKVLSTFICPLRPNLHKLSVNQAYHIYMLLLPRLSCKGWVLHHLARRCWVAYDQDICRRCGGGVRCAWLHHRAHGGAGSHEWICCFQALTTFICCLRSTKTHVCRLIPNTTCICHLTQFTTCMCPVRSQTHMCRLIQNATFICQSDFHFWTGQIPRTRHEESHQDLRCIDMFQSTNLLLFCVYVGSLQSYYTACQLYHHSIESRALTCPFKQSNLECLVTIDLTPHTYISLRETLFYPSCLLPTFTVTPSDSNYVNRSASLKHFS